ncbi:general substrate transporter [Hyaloscypha variabilis F]|uniref:General substrate transporter n=1 Tax=Hyaloscypha variabilis (strain UAMH 11265 / GT02V1 / F) TaxID=1149755 RepID=A0A2J6SB25_HYAVF|nr:general substrate transporter [Hyaloscypha variabilis F]
MANLTLYNIGIIAITCLGGFTYGFGFAVFVSSIGQPGFYAYFKLDPTSSYTASVLGAVNALFGFGAALGAIVQGWTADSLGRKKAFSVAAVCSIIGGALTAGAVQIAMLITVRLLQGFGLGMIICLVPLYISEVAPAHIRGRLSGLTVLSFGIGYVLCPFISIGTFHASNQELAWRLPLALACVGPLALLVGLPFIPESPRYLAWIGQNAEAWAVIQRIHNDPSDPSNSFAHAEFTQIVRQVEHDKEQKAGYIQMFLKPSWRRRSLLVMFLTFASQSTGILGITNFMVIILQTLGLEGDMPLLLIGTYGLFFVSLEIAVIDISKGIYSIVGTIAVVVALGIVDHVGRRTMLLCGYPAIAAVLLAEALLQWRYVGTTDKAGNAAALFFIFIYIICYQLVDSPSFIWAAEVFPTTIRAKGIGLTFFSYFVGSITYTTPAALAFKNIKWGMYLLWMGLCIISAFIVYFFIPETARLPMEEIGALFGDEVVIHLTSDGHGILEDKMEVEVVHIENQGEKIV